LPVKADLVEVLSVFSRMFHVNRPGRKLSIFTRSLHVREVILYCTVHDLMRLMDFCESRHEELYYRHLFSGEVYLGFHRYAVKLLIRKIKWNFI
jgi:hypothetical protein